MSPPPRALAAGVVVLTLASGCGSSADDDAAERAAHFYAAIAAEDAAAACADLAPEARESLEEQEGKPCADSILDQQLPGDTGQGEARVYGSMAQVEYPDETAFLSRYDDEWLLTAVGCPPRSGDQPHDCAIEVG